MLVILIILLDLTYLLLFLLNNQKTFGLSSVKIFGEKYVNKKEIETYESLTRKYKLIEKTAYEIDLIKSRSNYQNFNKTSNPKSNLSSEKKSSVDNSSKIPANDIIKTEDKDEVPIKRKNSIKNDDVPEKKKKVSSNQLMSHVIFCLSGLNKEHKQKIKEMACSLGAEYQRDWNSKCTHLM